MAAKPTNGHFKIPRKELVQEHQRLVNVLDRGNREELRRESLEQSKELKEYRERKRNGSPAK